jgi:hypothetical protein
MRFFMAVLRSSARASTAGVIEQTPNNPLAHSKVDRNRTPSTCNKTTVDAAAGRCIVPGCTRCNPAGACTRCSTGYVLKKGACGEVDAIAQLRASVFFAAICS